MADIVRRDLVERQFLATADFTPERNGATGWVETGRRGGDQERVEFRGGNCVWKKRVDLEPKSWVAVVVVDIGRELDGLGK